MKDSAAQPQGKAKPVRNKMVRFFDPPHVLRQKIGKGGIDPVRLKRAEDVITGTKIDFIPFAEVILDRMRKALAAAKAAPVADKKIIDTITEPIMEIKASGGMFGYDLVSEIAAVVLNFLENIDEINGDGFDILDVHQKTLEAIIKSRMKGNGGSGGAALAQELYEASMRYRKKYSLVVVEV